MIGIIDYGMSNLYSVKNACDYLGLDSVVSKDVPPFSVVVGNPAKVIKNHIN